MRFTQKIARSFYIALLMAGTLFSGAQTGYYLPEFEGADEAITAFMKKWRLTGGSVAIAKEGKLIYNRGFGYSDRNLTRHTRPDDQYRIASISKPVTAAAIMKLADIGQLDLDARVFGSGGILTDHYYLEVVNDQRIYDITVRHLLEHTAGWDRSVPYGPFSHCDAPFFPLYVTEAFDAPNPVGDSTLIRFKLGAGLHYAPGTHYAYSNVAYLVLGKVIEKITGIRYEQYVKQTILEPIGAYDTHLGSNLFENRLPREVEYINYTTSQSCYGDGAIVPTQYGGFNLEAMNAHGGWVSTAEDLTRFFLSLDGTVSQRLLSPEAITTMTTGSDANPGYAKGWLVNKKGNWWHTGSLDGTSAFAARTADGFTWVLLFNGRSDNSAAFWQALDRLPRTALSTVTDFPDLDLFAPAQPATELAAWELEPGTVHLSWTNGTGDRRMVVASETGLTAYPLTGHVYIGDTNYGLGTMLDRKAFVVYDGTGSRITLNELDPEKEYEFTVFEYAHNDETDLTPVYKLGAAAVSTSKPRLPKM